MNPIALFNQIRPMNCFLAAIGVFVGYSAATATISLPFMLILAMLTAFSITAAGNLINDYFDLEIDVKLGKKSALVKGKITPKELKIFTFILFAFGIAGAFFINLTALGIAIITALLLITYSAAMRKRKYIGNWIVALGTSLTLIYGAAITLNFDLVAFFAASAFFANVAREIIKDAEDIKGDIGLKKTLPMILSFGLVKTIVLAMYGAAVITAAAAWALGKVKGPYYIILLVLSTALFFRSWDLLTKRKLGSAQEMSKRGMIVALIAFLAAAI